jgi:hypothetical protein
MNLFVFETTDFCIKRKKGKILGPWGLGVGHYQSSFSWGL